MELVSETLMSFFSKSTILVRLSAPIKGSKRKTQDVMSKGIALRLVLGTQLSKGSSVVLRLWLLSGQYSGEYSIGR